MISKRLSILQALTAHLEAVEFNYGEEYVNVPLADRVFRGRTVFGDEINPPFVVILEAPRQPFADVAGEERAVRKDTWRLLIQGFAPEDVNNPLDPAYALLAAVELRLSRLVAQKGNGGGAVFPAEYKLGKKVSGIEFTNPIVRPPDNDVSDTAYFYLPVTFQVVSDMEAPFTEEA